MVWEPVLWLIYAAMNLTLLVSNLYQYLGFSDLESDYMNPYELSSRVNSVIVPEYLLHLAFCMLFLLTGYWIMFLILLPLACYNLMEYHSRKHLIDVTEVFRVVSAEKRKRIIKLGFYGSFLLLVIIRLTLSVIYAVFDEDDDDGPLHGYGIP